jgi:hypothetical protein
MTAQSPDSIATGAERAGSFAVPFLEMTAGEVYTSRRNSTFVKTAHTIVNVARKTQSA